MKRFAQNPARQFRNPRSADSPVRNHQTVRANAPAKPPTNRFPATLPSLIGATLLTILLAITLDARSAVPTAELSVLAWAQRYGSIASNSQERALRVVADAHGDFFVSEVTDVSSSDPEVVAIKLSGSDGTQIWSRRSGFGGVRNTAIDRDGNLVLTDYSLHGQTDIDYSVVRFASGDGTVLSEQRYPLPIPGSFRAMTTDANGNVVLVGSADGANGLADFHVARYTAFAGTLAWVKTFDGPAHGADEVRAVAVEAGGNVTVTGISQGDYYTAKYAGANGAMLWERRYNGNVELNYVDDPQAITVGLEGNAVVTGYSSNGRNWDFYTAKYAAEDGALIWERRYQGPVAYHAAPQAVAVDPGGNVVVTGWCVGTNFNYDFYTMKYAAADGTLLWEHRYNGPSNQDDFAHAAVIDASGNVAVSGFSEREFYTAKYAAADGEVLWEAQFSDMTLGGSHALALGSDASVVLTGTSNDDYVTVKFVVTQIPYPAPNLLSLSLSSAGARLRFTGDAGRTYLLQRAGDPDGPWFTIATLTASRDGAVEHLESAPLSTRAFYRVTAP